MHNFDINRTVKNITEYQQLFPTCVHESSDILAEDFYTIVPDGSRKAILWSHEKRWVDLANSKWLYFNAKGRVGRTSIK